VADAFVGNFQEKVMKDYSATQEDIIYYCYLFGSICIFFVCVIIGEFFPAILFCLESMQALFWIVSFSFTGNYCFSVDDMLTCRIHWTHFYHGDDSDLWHIRRCDNHINSQSRVNFALFPTISQNVVQLFCIFVFAR
jgi:hypothetical protein